ncbi:zinc finger protein RFP-like [Pangshura tecta]
MLQVSLIDKCREIFPQGSLRLNRQLRNVVEAARELRLPSGGEPEPERLCEKHKEPLKLFCKEDEMPICLVCDRSKQHRDHTVIPAEEAAEEFKEKIQAHLKMLREEREKLLGCKVSGEKRRQEHLVDTLPSALETERGGSLGTFRQANVTLDPDTAHPHLVLSEDQKRVRRGNTRQRLPDNPERFETEKCVLGCEGFTSGRHCWEVEVGDGGLWAVGVARESVGRKGGISRSPEGGIWAVERWGDQFPALANPVTPLPLSQAPSRIRVCLDCDRGQVTFIDAGDEAPIFTFPLGSVPGGRIRPWLWVGIPALIVPEGAGGGISHGGTRNQPF